MKFKANIVLLTGNFEDIFNINYYAQALKAALEKQFSEVDFNIEIYNGSGAGPGVGGDCPHDLWDKIELFLKVFWDRNGSNKKFYGRKNTAYEL